MYRVQSDVRLYVWDLENVRAIPRFESRPNGCNIVSYSRNNNVDGQHPRNVVVIIDSHGMDGRSSSRRMSSSPMQLLSGITQDVNTDGDKDVSHFSDNIHRYRCSARPKDPEHFGFSVDLSYIADDFLQADIAIRAVKSVLPNTEHHVCTFHMR